MTTSDKTVTSASGALTLTLGLAADFWEMTDRDRVLLEDILYLAASVPLLADPDHSPAPAVPDEEDVERDFGTDLFPCSCRTLYNTQAEVVACHVRGHTLPWPSLAYQRDPGPPPLDDEGIISGRAPLPRPRYDPLTRLWECHCGLSYAKMRGVLACRARDHQPLPVGEPEHLYRCDHPGCGQMFASPQGLGGHKASGHGVAGAKLECPHCHRMFDPRGYAVHLAAEEKAIARTAALAEGEERLAALVQEARASVALDGEAQSVGVPDADPEPGPQLSVMLDADGHDMRAPAVDDPVRVIPRSAPLPVGQPDPAEPSTVESRMSAGLRAMDAEHLTLSDRTMAMLVEVLNAGGNVGHVVYGWSNVDGGRLRRECGIGTSQSLTRWCEDFRAGADEATAAA